MVSVKSLLCASCLLNCRRGSISRKCCCLVIDYSHQLTGRGRTQAGLVRYLDGRYKEMHR